VNRSPQAKPKPVRAKKSPVKNGQDGDWYFSHSHGDHNSIRSDNRNDNPSKAMGTWHIPYIFATVILQLLFVLFAAGVAYNRISTTERDIVFIRGDLKTVIDGLHRIELTGSETKSWVEILKLQATPQLKAPAR
jgi:hypothetical protein